MIMKRNRIFDSFFIMSIFFVISIFVLRFIDMLFLGNVSHLSGLIYGNLIPSLFLSLCLLVVYIVISFMSKKAANIVAASMFSILFIIEAGLMVYHNSTGMLMGNEIIFRPLWETWVTIKSTLNFWIVAGTILLLFAYIAFSLFIAKRNINNFIIIITLLLMVASAPLFFLIKPNQDNLVRNKIWHCVYSCLYENNDDIYALSKMQFDNEKIENYKNLFPEKEILDNKYPLETKDNTENVLGQYFIESKKKPNVVVIVVESLGADLFGVNDYGYTFTPFLDSLSKHSLLWTNCLSTTPRSFGAVPAITGSVPHGTKGFQFGDIPEHNSLFTILKNNGYETNAFYAGDFSFDKVYDYLVAQKIDFLAPFKEEQKKKENSHYDYTYWGYQDKPMFDKSMSIIEQRDINKSYFDLFMTVSQHDNRLRLNDKERSEAYYERAREIIASLPEEEQNKMNEIIGHLAATIYGDEAIQYFVKRYSEFYNDGNYIFVITGDHSLNINSDNPLDAFHVPLIIWSPLLKEKKRFEAVVSHNDIVPTLNALLRDNFRLKTPHTTHWLGKELDTTANFHCDMNTCFLRYIRNIFDGIIDDYYYTTEYYVKELYRIKDKLELEKINDPDIIKKVDEKFNSMIYVDNYSYTNNKLTKYPIFSYNRFSLIENIYIDSVYCASNPEKPTVMYPYPVLFITKAFEPMKYDEIKIVMTADIKYTAYVWQDQFINLAMDYTYDEDEKLSNKDNISKNIVEKEYKPDRWHKLEITKTFNVKDFKQNEVTIYLQPTTQDYLWNPEHSVTLKNINVSFFGSELK